MMFNLKEKQLTKKAIFFGGIKGFVIILLTGFLVMTGLTFGDYREASLTEVSLSGIREVVMMDNELEVEQLFRAKYPKLNSIYVYFANEHEGKNAGNVIFTVLDRDGNQITSKQVAACDIINKDFTKVELKETLKMGQEYKLVVTGEGLTAGNAPIIYREKSSFGKTNVTVGEKVYKGKMEVKYFYPAETTVQVLLIMAATVGLMALLFIDRKKIFRGPRSQMAGKVLEQVTFYLAPIAAFYIMEQFTYNSILDIYPVAIGLNMVLYYSLYFGLYLITNSKRATIILTLLLSYILGAANYFVLTFRGNPILPTDIASLTTAMNVAENYTYTLNSAFFTNALLLLFLCIGFCRISSEERR